MDVPRPTDAELDLLQVLWNRGQATVRELHQAINPQRGTGLTTTLKCVQIMTGKGLIARIDGSRPARYRAALVQQTAQRAFLTDAVDRLFDGSTRSLVLSALNLPVTDQAELAELRRLLAQAEAAQAKVCP